MKLKIGNKLALVMIGLSVVVIVLLSALFYFQFELALKERVLLQLSSVKRLKISQIKDELHTYLQAFNAFTETGDTSALGRKFLIIKSISDQEVLQEFGVDSLRPGNSEVVLIKDLTPESSTGGIRLALVARQSDGSGYLAGVFEPDIQSVLLQRTGLGETGESYLVGTDYRMRSASRFFPDHIPADIIVKSEGVKSALQGKSSTGLFEDYRGVEVLSSYEKIEFHGLVWVILTEIDKDEAFIPLKKVRNNFVVIFPVILFFVLITSYWLARQIVKPLVVMETRLGQMAKGNIDQDIPGKKRQDEIGQMFLGLGRLVTALHQAIDFAGEIGSGNFNKEYALLSEHDKLGKALLKMRQELKNLKDNETRMMIESQKALVNAEETERLRISRELHDGLGPLLTIIRIKVQVAAMPEKTRADILKAIDETIREVRRISNNLMPSVLEDFGAGEALANLVKGINQGDIKVRYRYEPNELVVLPKSVNIAIYRIAQEALTNALRHSEATEINMSLTEFEDHVSLFISDNGVGFDLEKRYNSKGLINMKERVKLEDGLLDIHSGDRGTRIEVEFPLK